MSNGTNGKPSNGNVINVGAALKVAAVTLAIAGSLIGAVVYLEHKFQTLGEEISALKVEIRSMQNNIASLDEEVAGNREEYTNALQAIQENQYQLAVKLAECCASKGSAKDPVAAPSTPTILPYNLAFKKNPGIVIHKGAKAAEAKEAGAWFTSAPPP